MTPRPQFIVVDVETHKTEHYADKTLMGVAVAYQLGDELFSRYYLPDEKDECWEFLQGAELIMHNAAFDLRIIKENGFPLTSDLVFWDTMIMAHLVNENRYSFDLDSLAKFMLKEEKTDMKPFEKMFGGWNNIPPQVMGPYAEQDARLTYKLFSILRGELEKQGLLKVWKHSRETILTLMEVMAVGIRIDVPLAQTLSANAQQEMGEIERKLGFVPTKPKQLAEHLFVGFAPSFLSPTGKPVLDDAALRYYETRYPETQELIQDVLRYRKLLKARSTWYEGFQELMTPAGTLHPGLKQHGTKTGRLSCARPNLQQMPREGSRAKLLFKPLSDEYEIVECDYSQVELRLSSYYLKRQFGDSLMYDTYCAGADIHTLTTQSVGADNRQVGKTGNFLWCYGGSYKRFRAMMYDQFNIVVSVQDARKWTEGFHDTYPGFRRAIGHFDSLAQKQGYVKMWSGRRRHFGRNEKTFTAWNSVIQGGCGQILLISMNQIRRLQESNTIASRMCNTVHDSIWFMVPKNRMEEELAIIEEAMKKIPQEIFQMPFEVDSKPLYKSAETLVSA